MVNRGEEPWVNANLDILNDKIQLEYPLKHEPPVGETTLPVWLGLRLSVDHGQPMPPEGGLT